MHVFSCIWSITYAAGNVSQYQCFVQTSSTTRMWFLQSAWLGCAHIVYWCGVQYIYIHMHIHTALAQYNTLWSHHVYILVYLHTFSMGTENSSCTSSEPSSGGTSGCSCEPWVSHGNLWIEAAHISQWFVVNRPICIKCLPFWGGWIWRLLVQKGGKQNTFPTTISQVPPSQLQIAKQFPGLLPSGDCWPKLSSIMEWSSRTNSTVSQNRQSCPQNLNNLNLTGIIPKSSEII